MTSPRAFFVTGTDTDIGKTCVAAALLHAARYQGLSTAAGKPIASGSAQTPDGLRNEDALALQTQCCPPMAYELINPYAFEPAIAPHIAAVETGCPLDLSTLTQKMQRTLALARDITVIEGAGGWRVPITAQTGFSDLAKALNLPVILVVGIRLGALNHAALTQEAIEADGLNIAGWVANIVDPYFHHHANKSRTEENLATLQGMMHAPCLGIVPWLTQPTPEALATYLDFSVLTTQVTH